MFLGVQNEIDQLYQITTCYDCIHFNSNDLFEGNCKRLDRYVEFDDKCECFETDNVKVKEEIKRLVEIITNNE